MTTTSHGSASTRRVSGGYLALSLVLGVVTAAEWLLFAVRGDIGLPPQLLVPLLLGLSVGKFGAAVAYFASGAVGEDSWLRKAAVATLVFGGGLALSLYVLTRPGA